MSNVTKRKKKKKKKKKTQEWTVVTGKPKFKRVSIQVPAEVINDFTPLESAVYQQLLQTKYPMTATKLAEAIVDEIKCSQAIVGDVLYGRLKQYVEAKDWQERPRKWRIRLIKVKIE